MLKLFIIVVVIALLALVALFYLGYRSSHSGVSYGLVEGQLKSCPATPNCVSSEAGSDPGQAIEPLAYADEQAAQAMARLKAIIREMGGRIEVEQADYLAATFSSTVFRFVDDLELRVDDEMRVIHLRSASRVGRKDFGVNRERLERLRTRFEGSAD